MSTDSGSLLYQIEKDLVDGRPVADILRNLVVLGGRAGSPELRDWASQELRGYKNDVDLPDYRRVQAVIQLDAIIGNTQISRQTIAADNLPTEVHEYITNEVSLRHGVGEIEAMKDCGGDGNTVRFTLPDEMTLARMIDDSSGNPYQHITNIYWSVSITALAGIIDQIKTRLAELIGELRAVTPRGKDVPSPIQTSNAVHIVINGRGNSIQLANETSGVANSSLKDATLERQDTPFWTVGKRIGAGLVGIATIIGTVIAWFQFQNGGM